jgi:predicted TIM-barrel fold metal-dependent hydrolase
MCCLLNPEDLEGVSAMCQKYPQTRVVIDHFARIGADGQVRDADVQKLCDLAKHKQAHVKISAYYALGKKQPPYLDLVPMIRRVFDAYGPERTMWASDAPYQIEGNNTYQASIDLVKQKLDFTSAANGCCGGQPRRCFSSERLRLPRYTHGRKRVVNCAGAAN